MASITDDKVKILSDYYNLSGLTITAGHGCHQAYAKDGCGLLTDAMGNPLYMPYRGAHSGVDYVRDTSRTEPQPLVGKLIKDFVKAANEIRELKHDVEQKQYQLHEQQEIIKLLVDKVNVMEHKMASYEMGKTQDLSVLRPPPYTK